MKPTLYFLLGVAGTMCVSAVRPHTADYERGVNNALDSVLLTLAQARDRHEHPNWLTIERRAADRLHVKRSEPWLGSEK